MLLKEKGKHNPVTNPSVMTYFHNTVVQWWQKVVGITNQSLSGWISDPLRGIEPLPVNSLCIQDPNTRQAVYLGANHIPLLC